MGLLVLGTPLEWPETKKVAEYIRDHGITQFLYTWDRWLGRKGEPLLWGDEIEYMVISFKDDEKRALLSLRQTEILEKLSGVVEDLCKEKPEMSTVMPTFHPEYGRYMLESTPGAPYGGTLKDLVSVEADMRFRRKLARHHLQLNELPMTITSYPRLGVTDSPFTDPEEESVADSPASRSLFVGKGVTNPHVRFPTLTSNIRSRRGSKVAINIPMYQDVNTPKDLIDPTIPRDRKIWPGDDEAKNGAALPGHIYMDAMAFGMGCCCLQITFQACNVDEARRVYDALVPVAPIMLAMTAASPAFRGYLADVDARWSVIAASVDDRTEEERGLKPLSPGVQHIPKSRYDSVSCYISGDKRNKEEYNDIELPINEGVRQRLLAHGIDDPLAKHVAHMFIRDPLVVFSERIDQDDENSMDHFENIQSTNWQTVRFKPPPPNSPIAWRVEFRSMEVQITDFENAAFSIFIVLLTRAILSFDLDFYMPISQVDINMKRAQQRNAAATSSFFFRSAIFPLGRKFSHADLASRPASPKRTSRAQSPAPPLPNGLPNGHVHGQVNGKLTPISSASSMRDEGTAPLIEELTLNEVINGNGDDFPGLLGVVNAYVNSLNVDVSTKCKIREYLDLIKYRAQGKLITPASWIRRYITSHPAYKHDSVVSDEINYDLMKILDEIERGTQSPEVVADFIPSNYRGSRTPPSSR